MPRKPFKWKPWKPSKSQKGYYRRIGTDGEKVRLQYKKGPSGKIHEG